MRTTVSFSDVVNDWALELMRQDGYNDNFSAFLAALVREEKRRRDAGAVALNDMPCSDNPPAVAAPVSYKKKPSSAKSKSVFAAAQLLKISSAALSPSASSPKASPPISATPASAGSGAVPSKQRHQKQPKPPGAHAPAKKKSSH